MRFAKGDRVKYSEEFFKLFPRQDGALPQGRSRVHARDKQGTILGWSKIGKRDESGVLEPLYYNLRWDGNKMSSVTSHCGHHLEKADGHMEQTSEVVGDNVRSGLVLPKDGSDAS